MSAAANPSITSEYAARVASSGSDRDSMSMSFGALFSCVWQRSALHGGATNICSLSAASSALVLSAAALITLMWAPSAEAAWMHPGRCAEPRGVDATSYASRSNDVRAHRVACYRAMLSVDHMIEEGVQHTRPRRFRFTTGGARWRYRWSCTRTDGYRAGEGLVYRMRCTAGSRSMRFVLYP